MVSGPAEDRRPTSSLGIAVTGKKVRAGLRGEAFRVRIKASIKPIEFGASKAIASQSMIARELNPVRLGINDDTKAFLASSCKWLVECRSLGNRGAYGTNWARRIELLNQIGVRASQPMNKRT
jgi:hypothetical protein